MRNYERMPFENLSNKNGDSLTENNIPRQGTESWFAVHTRARHEKKANSTLTEKNVETFLPTREIVSHWKDRKKKVLMPLFPGYLFVNIDPRDRYTVLNTNGVVNILGNNGVPVPVPSYEIEATKRLIEVGLKYEPFPYSLVGREVEVVRGPLEGIMGRILRTKGAYSLILSVHLIRRSVSVEVDLNDVDFI
ncbi:MAG: transcription termination factor NusG domain protein [Thermodesulfobacteriota bacterium]|nr:MAG: transcription termination factor NusG domain protein [Thermodesulfobacteriota bacterium]